ncbi:MAG: LysM peptidoglycan-binding domain-containing protein, partial [Halanaerobiales bacterium]
ETDMQAYADIDLNRITASEISERELRVRAILDVNLLVTERVRVPVITGITDRPTQEPEQPTTPGQAITYVVKSGDTLYLIAQRFGVTVDRIIAVNNITDSGNIQIGQRLLIPRG